MNNVKELKKEATDFLGKKGRRIDMVFYCLILVFVLISPIFIFYYCIEILTFCQVASKKYFFVHVVVLFKEKNANFAICILGNFFVVG